MYSYYLSASTFESQMELTGLVPINSPNSYQRLGLFLSRQNKQVK
jgi:hypothetical protein